MPRSLTSLILAGLGWPRFMILPGIKHLSTAIGSDFCVLGAFDRNRTCSIMFQIHALYLRATIAKLSRDVPIQLVHSLLRNRMQQHLMPFLPLRILGWRSFKSLGYHPITIKLEFRSHPLRLELKSYSLALVILRVDSVNQCHLIAPTTVLPSLVVSRYRFLTSSELGSKA